MVKEGNTQSKNIFSKKKYDHIDPQNDAFSSFWICSKDLFGKACGSALWTFLVKLVLAIVHFFTKH